MYAVLCDKYLCYGGPEEGGWWYDKYVPRFHIKGNLKKCKKALNRLKSIAVAENEDERYSYTDVNGGKEVIAFLTRSKREATMPDPERKPYYE